MRRVKPKLLIASLLLLILGGCSDNTKSIQNLAYVTAIGLDYVNDQYIAYIQVLNFVDVAKTEQLDIGKNVPVWIGKGVGRTVNDSITSIYPTSQLRLFWGHVKAIVCTERLLRNGTILHEAYEAINRYHEVRYNVIVYGTKLPIPQILSQKALLNMSALDSLLDRPEESYKQLSRIKPQYVYKMIAELNEPARTAMMPFITIRQDTWMEDTSPKPMFLVDGASLFVGQQWKGWYSAKQLEGIRWVQHGTKRVLINVPDNANPQATLVLTKPSHKIKPVLDNGEVRFDIEVRAHGYIDQLITNLTRRELETEAAEAVERQIRFTFQQGLPLQTDTLNLLYSLYKKHPQQWKQLQERGKLTLNDQMIRKVQVKVKLIHSGKYKGRTR